MQSFNAHLSEIIKRNRPLLSENSVRTYVSLLGSLIRAGNPGCYPENLNINWFWDFDEVEKITGEKPPAVRKSYLSALVVLTQPSEVSETYRALMLQDIAEHRNEIEEQKMNPKQEENWLTFLEVKDIWKKMYADVKPILARNPTKAPLSAEERHKLVLFMLLSVTSGVFFPPRRSKDWTEMRTTMAGPETDNYYDLSGRVFVFNEHKTKRTAGQERTEFPVRFANIMKKYLKVMGDMPYLFENRLGKKLGNVQLATYLHDIFQRNISTSMLRHIYITHHERKTPELKALRRRAKAMGHSLETHLEYIKNRPTMD